MNRSIEKLRFAIVASALGLGFCGASGVSADTLIVSNHNASTGPKHDAMAHCLEAVKAQVGDGHSLVFSHKVVTTRDALGGQAVLVNATIWDDGARVPIEARCQRGAAGETVASISRVRSGPAIAAAK